MVVKFMVPFWIPVIVRHPIFRVPKKGTIILTTSHMDRHELSRDSSGRCIRTQSLRIKACKWLFLTVKSIKRPYFELFGFQREGFGEHPLRP